MYCPSCGKSVPENSKFCLHCGSSINAPTANTNIPEEWEYCDYLRTWKPGTGGKYKLITGENENTIRRQAWNDLQSIILPEIQQAMDKGWQPISEVGSAAFSFFYHTSLMSDYLEITEFRVKMRRQKENGAVDISRELHLVKSQPNSRPAYENQIIELVRRGKTIEAIKLYRQNVRASLTEAKDYVDSINRIMRS